jgi:putative glycosyltransferase (TIGR04348 family)
LSLEILLVNPASTETRKGNHVTSDRWAHHFETLGHQVKVETDYQPGDWDVMVALHAYKSAGAIRTFEREHPHAQLVVALTGTDVYRDLQREESARDSIRRADDLVLLQPLARKQLPDDLTARTHVVSQSVLDPPDRAERPGNDREHFVALSVAHLRDVKDPLRLGHAVRDMPADSHVKAYHFGGFLDESYRSTVEELERSGRFEYLGEVPRDRVLASIRGSDVLVISSRLEGGANVVTESILLGTPVLASDIPGNRGLLGNDYPGYFPVGDTEALRELLVRCSTERDFYRRLKDQLAELKDQYSPAKERAQWENVLQYRHSIS